MVGPLVTGVLDACNAHNNRSQHFTFLTKKIEILDSEILTYLINSIEEIYKTKKRMF